MIKRRKSERASSPPSSRDERGISLATILAIGTVSSLWITAMMAIVMPTYQKTASLKSGTAARAAAEAALDYTLNQMNNSISQGQISSYDCDPTTVGSSKLSTISPSALGLSQSNATIKVLVQNVALAGPQSGSLTQPMIFDPQLAQLINSGKLANPYRQLTASVTIGSVTKLLRVTLVPQSVRPSNGSTNGTVFPTMPFAIYGVNQTAFVGSVGLNSYVGKSNGHGAYVDPPAPRPAMLDPRVRADFGSGTTVNQVGYGSSFSGMALGGTQMEFCDPIVSGTQAASAIAQMYNASAVAKAPWVDVYDNVYSNYPNAGDVSNPVKGIVYADKTTAGLPGSGYIPRGWDNSTANGSNQNSYNNVFGLSNTMGYYPFDHASWGDANYNASTMYPSVADNNNMGGVLSSAQQYSKPQIPPVPTSPSTAVHLGNINLSGSAQIVITKAAPMPTAQIGSISKGTILLPPGDYSITGLSMTGTSKIIIDPTVQNPTNFYLEGNVSTNAAVPAVNIANTCDINMSGLIQTPGTASLSIGSTGFNLSGSTGENGHGSTISGTSTAINRTSSINEIAGSAGFLNLYYNGPGSGASAGSPSTPPSTTFAFNGKQRMTVFAPNANILIGAGTDYTRPSEFFGAVVGNWVTVTGPRLANNISFTAFHYDVKLRPNGGAFTNPNQTVSVWGNPTSGDWTIAGGYKAVTWQEAKIPSNDPSAWSNTSTWQ